MSSFLYRESSDAQGENMKTSMVYEMKISKLCKTVTVAAIVALSGSFNASAEIGVTNDKIIIGGVMDLEGRSRGLGQGM